jgi:hypothetical protein
MTKRNRNIKNIFIKLQMGTNIMANQVKTPIQNYFEKVLYENLTFEIPPLWFFKSSRGNKKNCNKTLCIEFLRHPLKHKTFRAISLVNIETKFEVLFMPIRNTRWSTTIDWLSLNAKWDIFNYIMAMDLLSPIELFESKLSMDDHHIIICEDCLYMYL